MARWKDKLLAMDVEVDKNIDDLQALQSEPKSDDIGLVNPKSGAGILVRENGVVESFADYGLGFRIDPSTQSFSIYAPNLKLFYQKKEEISFNKKTTFLKDEYKDVLQLIESKGD